MTTDKYHQALIQSAIPSGKHLNGYSFTFQKDNDPKQTANAVKYTYIEKHWWIGLSRVRISTFLEQNGIRLRENAGYLFFLFLFLLYM